LEGDHANEKRLLILKMQQQKEDLTKKFTDSLKDDEE
jgi:hypothetical protein